LVCAFLHELHGLLHGPLQHIPSMHEPEVQAFAVAQVAPLSRFATQLLLPVSQ
jgi:hypothetical protein